MYLLAWLLMTRALPPAHVQALAHDDHDDDEAGQATAEYALVLLGAAAVALLVVTWATKTNIVAKLLDAIFDQLLHRVASR